MPTELIINCTPQSTEKFTVVEMTHAELAERHITDAAAYVMARQARKDLAIRKMRALAATDELARLVLEMLGLDDA
jgi:hypothetical protein